MLPDVDINSVIESDGNLKDEIDRTRTINAIENWNELTYHDACVHHHMLNSFNNDDVGREWCMSHVKNSVTLDLLSQINLKYDKLDVRYQGCVTFTWLLMQEVFGSARESTESLQLFLKLVKKKGLGHYLGEDVNQMADEIKAVASKLEADNELRSETSKDVVTALPFCSVDKFKKIFDD